jgi:hypothetical protein
LFSIVHAQAKHSKEAASEASVYICSHCPFKTVSLDTYVGHQRSHLDQGGADGGDAGLEKVIDHPDF